MTQKATRAQTDRTHTMPQCFLLPRRQSRLPPSTPYSPSPPPSLRMEPVWPQMIRIFDSLWLSNRWKHVAKYFLHSHDTCHMSHVTYFFAESEWVTRFPSFFPCPTLTFREDNPNAIVNKRRFFSITFSLKWWLWTKSNTYCDDDDESASCFPFPRVRRAVWNLKRMQFFDWWILLRVCEGWEERLFGGTPAHPPNGKSAKFIREKSHPQGL